MNPFLVTLFIYTSLLVFYVLYIAAINIYYDWATLARWVKCVVFVPLAVMMLVDVVMQCTLFTLLFWDLPREWLVTQRLARYRSPATEAGMRKRAATEICTKALNPFDPTRKHC